MTPTEKQKTIAEQAVYGDLYGIIPITDMCLTDFCVCRFLSIDKVEIGGKFKQILDKEEGEWGNEPTPILRPLDLTKEITHKGYNENQPFIPLVELAKEQYEHLGYRDFKILSTGCIKVVECSNEDGDRKIISISQTLSGIFVLCQFQDFNEELTEESVPLLPIFDLLHQWHFDTRNLIEEGEAISTDEVNPYEVK